MKVQAPKEFGRYWLVQRIAAGGMAEIFKARYAVGGGIEKTCVIKRILPHLTANPGFIEMFHQEARITVGLNHANIVQVFDFGQVGEDHFLAMEYVQGQNLRKLTHRLWKQNDKLPLPISLFVASETARGLHYAHTRKDEQGRSLEIIHRDVSPANILVSYEGEVKITDFGIAKAASQHEQTQVGVVKGKASYMAPEYLIGAKLDGRADVFALGVVMWELLIGRKLFTGENEAEIIAKIPQMEIPIPSSLDPTIPEAVDTIVMKALERNPAYRYDSAGDLHRDLARAAAERGLTITAPDVGEFVQALFLQELQAEMEKDRELSQTFINLKVKVDEPTSLTPSEERPRTAETTPHEPLPLGEETTSNPRPVSAFADSPLDVTAEVEETLVRGGSAQPPESTALPPDELSAAAKRQAQRNIKAGVFKPKSARRSAWPRLILYLILLLSLLGWVGMMIARDMGLI